jgi:3-hydroxyisobutyrate dehydrogenase-like beta-hydroxyacid dehydrogenase
VTVPAWGIIGFGQAGSAFASHLGSQPHASITVTDPALNRDPLSEPVRERLAGVRVEVAPDIPALLGRSDLVLSLVTAAIAAEVAEAVAGAPWTGTFVDLNSVSPEEKRHLAVHFRDGAYVDGAVLGNVTRPRITAQLAVSGPKAEEALGQFVAAGFNVVAAGPEVGNASAVKMCRSIFMKGVECLFVETMLAAREFDVGELVLNSIDQTFTSLGVRGTARMLMTTHAVHSGRRADEMRHVVSMLESLDLGSDMSGAAAALLEHSAGCGLTDHFHGLIPERWEDVIAYLARRNRGEA